MPAAGGGLAVARGCAALLVGVICFSAGGVGAERARNTERVDLGGGLPIGARGAFVFSFLFGHKRAASFGVPRVHHGHGKPLNLFGFFEGDKLPNLDVEDLPPDFARVLQKRLKPIFGDNQKSVFQGKSNGHEPRDFILKRLSPKIPEEVESARRELELIELFNGRPGFLTVYSASNSSAYVEAGADVYLLMERAVGNLQELVVDTDLDRVNLETRLRLFADVLRGVVALSGKRIVHRDLKPTNILIVGNEKDPSTWRAVLCGFGHVCTGNAGRWPSRESVGKPPFLPPGVDVSTLRSTPSRDVWALGLILHQVLIGDFPPSIAAAFEVGPEETQQAVDFFDMQEEALWEDWRRATPDLADLTARMLARKPEGRYTAGTALGVLERCAEARGFSIAPFDAAPPIDLDALAEPPTTMWKYITRKMFGPSAPETAESETPEDNPDASA